MAVLTDTPVLASPEPTVEAVGSPARRKFRKRGVITKWLAITWLVLLVFTAIGASWLPYVNHDCSQFENSTECSTNNKGSVLKLEKPPAWAGFSTSQLPSVGDSPVRTGWFGTDSNGFDMFSRAIFGGRLSLMIGALSVIFGLLIGGSLGLLAGYKGGRIDRVLDTIMNIVLAFPALLLAVFIVGFFDSADPSEAENRSIWPIIFALVILSIPPLQKLVRANTLVYSQREFVTASRSLGASDFRIVTREILPNVLPVMLTFALTGMALLIVAEGALAFVGLSVSSPDATWGSLILAGKDKLENAWWMSMLPAAMMFLSILSINLLGDVLSEKFRVRESIG